MLTALQRLAADTQVGNYKNEGLSKTERQKLARKKMKEIDEAIFELGAEKIEIQKYIDEHLSE